jgi:hypothetical protein
VFARGAMVDGFFFYLLWTLGSEPTLRVAEVPKHRARTTIGLMYGALSP